jgi:hypothetical protein
MFIKAVLRQSRQLVDRALSNWHSKAASKIIAANSGDYFVSPVPPACVQFASPKLVSDILDKKIQPSDDPKWQSFGFKDKKDYDFWSWRLCGLMCVRAVLSAYALGSGKTVSDLTTEGVKLGGYDIKNDNGWFSARLLRLAKSFGLKGRLFRHISNEEIAAEILGDHFFVASVNPEVIRGDIEMPNYKGKGGHLVLIWGVKIHGGGISGFYINNPSGRKSSTQEKAFIPIRQFDNAFGKRGFSLFH